VHTSGVDLFLPLAHVSHWLWVLYLPPILIVAGSIVRSVLVERRGAATKKADAAGGNGDSG
jgi:hypothetical protein